MCWLFRLYVNMQPSEMWQKVMEEHQGRYQWSVSQGARDCSACFTKEMILPSWGKFDKEQDS